MAEADDKDRVHPTAWQRAARRQVLKQARKRSGEPLEPEDWLAYFMFFAQPRSRLWKRMLRALPASPRCGYCGAPFEGFGGRLVRPLGYRPSRKNPNICATCVELAPPGGITMRIGVLFADLRGFTTLSEGADPREINALLRRFYSSAEQTLFPEALIDKLIGDEVMALYLPGLVCPREPWPVEDKGASEAVAPVMVDHALRLLENVGYGDPGGPFAEVGVGMDFGEAFVGNVGDRAVHDFTAIGDVVNTASRLQGQARGGEVLISARVAEGLREPPGEPVQLELKGKAEPTTAYRLRP